MNGPTKEQYTAQYVAVPGVRLHVITAGPEDGQPVILLHGFPEFWYGWRHQIHTFAQAGFRVIAPDQRGYNLSGKPKGISAYRLDTLAGDIAALMDAMHLPQASVVGHDWGGIVAWWLALKYPQRLTRLAVLNAPHPAIAVIQALRHPTQLIRSLYISFFQWPWLPEYLLRLHHDWGLRSMLLRSRPGTFDDAEIHAYMQAWSQPGALTHMLHWYRALVQRPTRIPRIVRIGAPTLLIWGARDLALGRYLAQPSIDLCDRGQLVFIENATHWVQHEQAARVNALLGAFLLQQR